MKQLRSQCELRKECVDRKSPFGLQRIASEPPPGDDAKMPLRSVPAIRHERNGGHADRRSTARQAGLAFLSRGRYAGDEITHDPSGGRVQAHRPSRGRQSGRGADCNARQPRQVDHEFQTREENSESGQAGRRQLLNGYGSAELLIEGQMLDLLSRLVRLNALRDHDKHAGDLPIAREERLERHAKQAVPRDRIAGGGMHDGA